MPMTFKVILIITMISGELNYAQESFEVKTLLPRLKRWQKEVNINGPSSTISLNKPIFWIPGDPNQLSDFTKIEEAMLHFAHHTKQIWTQMNALRQENDKLKDDMLQLWSQNHQMRDAIIINQKTISQLTSHIRELSYDSKNSLENPKSIKVLNTS